MRAVGNRRRANPYVQVALTYIRRPLASWPGRILALGWIPAIICVSVFLRGRKDADFTLLMVAFMFICVFSAIQIAQQFSDAHAHLTPAFRRVHIVVVAIVALVIAVLLPAIITWSVGFRSIALVASATFMFGASLCMFLSPLSWLNWITAVGIIASCTPWGKAILYRFVAGEYEIQALGLLVVGVTMTLLGGLRLIRLNEDMPEFHKWNSLGLNRMTRQQPMAGAAPSRGFRARLSEWIVERQMAATTRHARRASTSWWSSVCRWQVGMMTGLSTPIIALLVFLYCAGLVWVAGQSTDISNTVFPMLIIVLIAQGFLWGIIARRRAQTLTYELLLPVDRRTYFRQMGLAAALSQIQIWAGLSVGLAAWVLITAGQPFALANLAVLLGIFTLLQPWCFGLGAWFARFHNIGLLMVAAFVAIYAAMIPIALFAAPGPMSAWRNVALPLAGTLAAIGLLITFDAYRRWLVADVD